MTTATTLTTEKILTSEACIGLTTASPAQRAKCRVLDGLPLGELANDPSVVTYFGGEQAVAALPVGVRPTEFYAADAIRTAKTLTAVACAIRATQTVDISHLKPGEIARVSIVSLTLDLARVAFSQLVGVLTEKPLLQRLLVGTPTADSVMLRHPSGRPVEIKVVAGRRGGAQLVARWSAGVIFDEAARMVGSEDGAVTNLDDARASVLGRLLNGAQLIYIGSPWTPTGPFYKNVMEGFGEPTSTRVVARGTGPLLNPSWWTPERCEQLRRTDERVYRTDVLGEFVGSILSVFTAEQFARASGRSTRDLRGYVYPGAIAYDPNGGKNRDRAISVRFDWVWPANAELPSEYRKAGSDGRGWEVDGNGDWIFAPEHEWRLQPTLCFSHWQVHDDSVPADVRAEELIGKALSLGARTIIGDQFSAYTWSALLQKKGITYHELAWTLPEKARAVEGARQLLKSGQIAFIEDETPVEFMAMLRAEMLGFEEHVNPTGSVSYAAGRGHDDAIMCVLLAIRADAEGLLQGTPVGRRPGHRRDNSEDAQRAYLNDQMAAVDTFLRLKDR